ncbi:helicase MOV-10 [Chlorella sorokiniana]|uniref:Helicase MOV-10 n=1 Tax=Chlorella sorokiniana TaxID=3076 RepID=A0A2P6TUW4_CHLSO|nr:helicase MOV-10 [Chlorella sorokiniana]|eukprot:PRW57862.1 helicase MOV-10 [Chlorella sorokiniana]
MARPDQPPKLHKAHVTQASHQAERRLHQLFPRLPPWVHGYLLHRVVAHYAKVPGEELLGGRKSLDYKAFAGAPCEPIPLHIDRAVAACNSVAYGPAAQVAAVAAPALEALRQQYLAGASEQELGALVARRFVWTKNSGNKLRSLLPGLNTGPGGVEADLARLVYDPSCAEPHLPPAAGDASKRALPPAPPPPLRGAVVDVPPALRPLFGGGAGGQLLQRLLRQAVAELPTALALGAAHSGSGQRLGDEGQPPAETMVVGGDIDFGTVPVTRLKADQLVEAAAAAAAGLPQAADGSSLGGTAAGSLLDLLHLASAPQQQQQASCAAAADSHAYSASSGSGSGSTLLGAAAQGGPVLHFRQLVVENRSSSDELWLLGGVAAPSFPHTLATIDDARLFWLDGHQAVRLGPQQQHTISVALSSADCAARRQEKGILQQLLLLVFAAAPHTRTAQALDSIVGAAVAECPVEWAAGAGWEAGSVASDTASGAAGAAAAASATMAEAAAAGAPAPASAPMRLFVVARRVTVALVDRPAELAFLMSADAKPFVSERLHRLFSGPPSASLHKASLPARHLLLTGQHMPEISGQVPQPLAHAQQGRAMAGACVPHTVPPAPAAQRLQRLSRLLLLEEAALEQDVTRFDQFNVRLRLALFDSWTANRCRLVSLAPSPGGGERQQQQSSSSIMYRGPTVGLLQPGGVASPGTSLYALAVLDVPGMPEGRPALLLGDAVYIRTAHQPAREIVALVAATDGSTAFLLLPAEFWEQPDVAPLIPHLAAASSALPESTHFDGLVHARFSFDRGATRRMQQAIEAAGLQQVSQDACWLPPDDLMEAAAAAEAKRGGSSVADGASGSVGDGASGSAAPSASGAAMAANGGNASRTSSLDEDAKHRIRQLQPGADAVAAVAANLQERGKQRLNAEQRTAVAAVVSGAGRAFPYALFGPPGTGKTVTLVECALQLLQAYPHARLLLCAPLNYSADLLCSALAAAGLGSGDMLRLNDPRRPPFTVKEDVLPFSTYDEATRMFGVEPELCRSRRVVVATCGAAGLLQEGPFASAPCRFTHVLIDEAGQALPPEALIPLALLAPAPPQWHGQTAAADPGWGAVLCGDPRQLGPVVRSQVAAAHGLATSLLETCIAFHTAAAHDVLKAGRVPGTSMLVRNYRSHGRLLDLPSKLFYQGSLVAAADPRSVLPPRWRELQAEEGAEGGWEEADGIPRSPGSGSEGRGGEDGEAAAAEEAGTGDTTTADSESASTEQPPEWADGVEADGQREEEAGSSSGGGFGGVRMASLLFYGVRGQQQREGDAPSYFNALEASTVVELVVGLLSAGAGVQADDIGVMATYRKQVQKIRLLLRQRGLGAIRVGTVDDYQGQEERIIFISTVLSRPESLPPARPAGAGGGSAGGDVHLGFWRNPKRFNVAVTRAKALLVVVGQPAVLLEDASWRELLRYCFSQGAYRGAGADAIRQRFRVDVGAAAGALPELPGDGTEGGAEGAEEQDEELQRAIGQLAELALLGAGRAADVYPETLEEMYAASLDEAPFRVML